MRLVRLFIQQTYQHNVGRRIRPLAIMGHNLEQERLVLRTWMVVGATLLEICHRLCVVCVRAEPTKVCVCVRVCVCVCRTNN